MADWQSMETAPKDGTVIWLRNAVMMEDPTFNRVLGHWDKYELSYGRGFVDGWVSDFTDLGLGDFFSAGNLIFPDEWMPTDD